MFTRGGERLVMRGSGAEIPYSLLSHSRAAELSSQGWRLSGHTHTPGFLPVGSPGDISILKAMGQNRSAVWGTGTDLRPGIFYSSGNSGADAINALLGIR